MSGAATTEGAVTRFDAALVGTEARDWFALLKPRVISLVVFTGAAGLAMAPGPINPLIAAVSILCICMASGAAGAINMWYDRDIDAVMTRTARRPIPDGRIRDDQALGFGIGLSVASVLLMWLAANALAAFILAFSIFFYAVIYTMWLKRSTPQNIVIGGAAGAFPPMIGWAATTGSLGVLPVVMFAIVFLWTPPHFWSLSLYACKDYGRAGIPMLPVVRGARHTRWQILFYTLILSAVSLVPSFLHQAGWLYTGVASLLDAGFVACAVGVLTDRQDEAGVSLTGDRPARRAFRYSLAYLFLLFCGLLADHFLIMR
ncbi:protoheme IX farnesyltransferase [Gluconacetobacter diazotrophicus PA1 5]|uniref:Protoheme IX farnesyltransferase n=2 Tax=Gluconacetobacter diazotrophicus TaxID=33996 RepID=COXX_GLUDA|nr:heme o synthase [Gluconacetobacter diazotrophicus]A9HKH7.1 RecName: Full=Protoheme IX farnesyltransferase; AltName: Full=Heme B farnesyltransferase; AltName: Full=Heme O synthase [Gluconacetobacter diazotrophicus PA1 5]ACI50115.1 protoheme IX farnesyltransferase [Gluconacetobacter diazotrophicus PA1 5]MBB2154965.1 protoheme IX farnesyltransferase [Gluconacetobacter diazotrophicus]TWB08126.1 protoheme IX farnesyltransferase [Gluconacetobacter diazotrophicus]CAP56043.1 putative protoheme IX f